MVADISCGSSSNSSADSQLQCRHGRRLQRRQRVANFSGGNSANFSADRVAAFSADRAANIIADMDAAFSAPTESFRLAFNAPDSVSNC